ncbi:MAG: hypothetical protein SGCHY_005520 [Lobulomycetales sp.]
MPKVRISRYSKPFEINYETHGADHDTADHHVILIMGLGATMHNWHAQVDHLTSLPGYAVAILDNRGVGHSDPAPTLWNSTHEMAKDVKDLADHLNWTSFHLVGASMGGMIAQELTLLAPQAVRSLTLISTHPGRSMASFTGMYHMIRGMTASDQDTRFANVGAMLFPREFLESPAPKDWRPQHLGAADDSSPMGSNDSGSHDPAMGSNDSGFHDPVDDAAVEAHEGRQTVYTMDDVFRDRELDVAKKVPRAKLFSLLQQVLAVFGHYVSPSRLKQIKDSDVKVLVATGTDDLLVHAANSDYLSSKLDAPLRVFPNYGHSLAFQAARDLGHMIQTHIESTSSSS